MEIPETRDLFFRTDRALYENLAGDKGWIVGRDLGADIVILDDNRVVAFSDGGIALVNSSVQQYARTLVVVGDLRDHLAMYPDDEDAISCSEQLVREIDEYSYSAGQYWGLIFEQIREQQF
jgi:hypothetical protein